ncbi:MAG: ABC transporter ATP-binding protein [Bryobacterales bacterium]|nr:ABC transporter ATP-binding protein [Bryobacterales bacterium]
MAAPNSSNEEQVSAKRHDWQLTWRMLSCLLPYRKQVLVALVALSFYAVLQVVPPLLSKLAIDSYLANPREPLPPLLAPYLPEDPATAIVWIAAAFFATLLITFLLQFIQSYIMQWTGQHAMFGVRRSLMEKLQQLDLAYYDRNPVGRLVTRVTTDVDVLNELFASGLVTALADVLSLSLIVTAMFWLSPQLTLLLLLAVPVVVYATYRFRKASQEGYSQTRLATAKINAFLNEHVTGIAVLQLFNRQQRAKDDFSEVNQEYREAMRRTIFAYGWFYPVVEFTGAVALAAILARAGVLIQNDAVSIGALVAFFQYGSRFFRPIQELSEKYNLLQSALSAGERIFKLIDTPLEIEPPASPKSFPEQARAIEFENVWFAYNGEDWVLRDFSVRIEPGEMVAIVGHTGAGKTTLISLLLRFYDVQKGSIRIGGIDIRELDSRDLRRHFGIVLQDPYLFTGTLGGNIRLGSSWIQDEDMISAAEQVNLLDYIETLPLRFDQPVRERGEGLSTGQKQLVSFARALAHNPRFLILDEATSSVDTETEQKVRDALGKMVVGRTSLIIAHRLSTIQKADRILVMHRGELREQGTHRELVLQRGIYHRLYELQYRDQEAADRAARNATGIASRSGEGVLPGGHQG